MSGATAGRSWRERCSCGPVSSRSANESTERSCARLNPCRRHSTATASLSSSPARHSAASPPSSTRSSTLPGLLPAGSERTDHSPDHGAAGHGGRIDRALPGAAAGRSPLTISRPYLADHGPGSDDAGVSRRPSSTTIAAGAGLRFVDTPGSVDSRPATPQLTLAALSRAEALIFVADPTVPLTRGELDFVVAAAARTAVFFVIARIDGASGWSEILDHDRRLVAEHAPQLAGAAWFPSAPS